MSDEIRTAAVIEAELASLPDNNDDVGQDEAVIENPQATYEAGRKGWVPKDQYKKDPATWVDADTFLQRGDRFVANLQRDVQRLTQQLADFEGTKAAFVKFSEDTLARKDVELKEAIANLRTQRVQAIREGEDDLAIQIEDRIDLLRDQQKTVKAIDVVAPPPVKNNDADDPVLQEWISEDNAWFNENVAMRDFAIKIGEALIANKEPLRGRRFLDKIRSIMETEFPRRFQKKETNARPSGESSTAQSGARSGDNSGKTERDLPKEDLALMKEFIASGLMTKEKFLKSYFSRNG